MSRLRRIELLDRIFFVTTNLAKGLPPLLPLERDVVLRQLGEARAALPFLLLGYVVMPDHVHVVVAARNAPLSRIMHRWKFKTGYCLQKARRGSGAFWQARYFDSICRRVRDVSDKLLYVHENPVAASLVKRAEEWRWSSAGYYCGNSSGSLLVPDRMDFSGDPDELLWPAPWRRL
jgi:putative transposase